MDVADMDAVMAAMETPGAREAMAHDGVLPETLVILVEGVAVTWTAVEGVRASTAQSLDWPQVGIRVRSRS
jgi:hypothetical protein